MTVADLVPRMFRARQLFPHPRAVNIPAAVVEELERLFSNGRTSLRPGMKIGVTVGSRGIADIATIARAAVDFFKSRKVEAFIIAAMGSHGGATAEGQRSLIAHYGVTEDAMGCPVRCEMETLSLGRGAADVEIFMARTAWESDGILLLNRIKPHTDFKGKIESGLAKICAIGLGKLEGAREYHSRIFDLGLEQAIRIATEKILATGKIIGALGILENAYHETARLAAVPVSCFFDTEEKLLLEAKGLMGRLPFDEVDLLICDRMGKNISGTGLDTNIIGRSVHGYIQGVPWIEGMPAIHRIFVRDLSEETDGNGVGMGLADFSTSRMMQKVDQSVTQLNAFTARTPFGAKQPALLATDREAIATALSTCRPRSEGALVIHIRDTLSLEYLGLSEAFLTLGKDRKNLEILGPPQRMQFDPEGWMESPFVKTSFASV